MPITVTRYSKTDNAEWENFVRNANNGTLFHSRLFLGYHPKKRFIDHSLIFCTGGSIISLLPAVDFQDKRGRILISHRGASYGGLVVKDTLSIREAFDIVSILLDYAKKEGFCGIDITPAPQIYLKRPSNYIDFALVQNGFTYRKREISSVIPLDFSRDSILQTFSESSRRAVRRAQKLGTVVRASEDYERFYRILEKNLRLRHGVKPTHSLEELQLLHRIYPDDIRLFAAYHDEKMVAGVVMFVCNQKVVLAFYISHDDDFQQFRGVNLLFYEIIDWGITNGYDFLDFGIFTVNEDPNWGLARFKESFGAQGVFRDSLYCTLSR